jgi:DNA-binding NarL/FixJ family response regulator
VTVDGATPPANGTVTVLVVDDQPPFRDAARAVVDRLAGFEVIAEADSGEAAIELIAQLSPQLVLMDINMGGINGIVATQRISQQYPGTKVVLMSTYELGDIPATARTSGAIAYVNKDDLGVRALRRLWENDGDPLFRPTARTPGH